MYLYRPMLGKKNSIESVSKAYTQNTRRINSTRASRFHYYGNRKGTYRDKEQANDLLGIGTGWTGYSKQNFLNVGWKGTCT